MTHDRIPLDDPRHEAAQRVLDAMHAYWEVDPFKGAVRWIEDTSGRVIIFTRGEYRDVIRDAIGENAQPTEEFEQRLIETEGIPFGDYDDTKQSQGPDR